jgi:hypothetical protein
MDIEPLGAPFGSTVYPGRLNPRELNDYRGQEIYEAVMTDLVNMGILSVAQFEEYNHRRIQASIKPLEPVLDPFPTLVPKQYDASAYGGKVLTVDPDSGLVTPELPSGVFKQLFEGHVGIGYSVDPDGNPPTQSGTVQGQYWYMLVWNGQWDIIEWMWDQGAWDFDAAEIQPVSNFNYVMIYDDATYTTSSGWFVLFTGSAEQDIPTWQALTPTTPSLPDVWIDEPHSTALVPGVEKPVMLLNLKTGQRKQKMTYYGYPIFEMGFVDSGESIGETSTSDVYVKIDIDNKISISNGCYYIMTDPTSYVKFVGLDTGTAPDAVYMMNVNSMIVIPDLNSKYVSIYQGNNGDNSAGLGIRLKHGIVDATYDYAIAVQYWKEPV